jgi:hypothetical protein
VVVGALARGLTIEAEIAAFDEAGGPILTQWIFILEASLAAAKDVELNTLLLQLFTLHLSFDI